MSHQVTRSLSLNLLTPHAITLMNWGQRPTLLAICQCLSMHCLVLSVDGLISSAFPLVLNCTPSTHHSASISPLGTHWRTTANKERHMGFLISSGLPIWKWWCNRISGKGGNGKARSNRVFFFFEAGSFRMSMWTVHPFLCVVVLS